MPTLIKKLRLIFSMRFIGKFGIIRFLEEEQIIK